MHANYSSTIKKIHIVFLPTNDCALHKHTFKPHIYFDLSCTTLGTSSCFMSMQQRPQASTSHLYTCVLFTLFSLNCIEILFHLETNMLLPISAEMPYSWHAGWGGPSGEKVVLTLGSHPLVVYLVLLCWSSMPSVACGMEGKTPYTSTTRVRMTAEKTSPSMRAYTNINRESFL